MPIDQE